MSTATALGTLRATNCYGLTALSASLVVALGPRTCYVLPAQPTDSAAAAVDVSIPEEATAYALWSPTASTDAASAYIVYVAEGPARASGEIHLLPASKSSGGHALLATLGTASNQSSGEAQEEESIHAVHVFFQSVLVVERDSLVQFYRLDAQAVAEASSTAGSASSSPSTLPPVAAVTLPLLGSCPLMVGTHSRSQAPVLISASSPSPSSQAAQEVLVACIDQSRHTLAVQVVAVTSTSASPVRFTDPRHGVTLPEPLRQPLVAWSVNWSSQELVLLCREAPASGARDEEAAHRSGEHTAFRTHCGCLSLRRADVAAGNQLTRWVSQPSFVNAATRPLLELASDLQCHSEGGVCLVDNTTGPTVVMRDIASTALETIALPGTGVNTKVFCAAGGDGVLYVLAGRRVFRIGGTSTSPQAVAAAASVTTAAARLRKRLAQPPQSGATTTTTTADEAITAEADATLTAILKKGAPWQPTGVVRDVRLVSRSQGGQVYTHALLDSPRFRKLASAEQVRVALQYVAGAETVHPYTALLALAVVPAAFDDDEHDEHDGARLAIAVLLARKETLRDGGLQRHNELPAAAADFASGSHELAQTPVTQKSLLAAFCRTANSALALGSLGAAAILHTVADAFMTQLYGHHRRRECQPLDSHGAAASSTKTQASLEQSIAASIALMKQYSQWALTNAATALGTVSAHVGEARESRKEACLRDARSHPITTSRNVDIKTLRLARAQAAPASTATK